MKLLTEYIKATFITGVFTLIISFVEEAQVFLMVSRLNIFILSVFVILALRPNTKELKLGSYRLVCILVSLVISTALNFIILFLFQFHSPLLKVFVLNPMVFLGISNGTKLVKSKLVGSGLKDSNVT